MGMGAKIGAKLLRTLNGHRQSVYCLSKVNSKTVVSSGGDGLIVVWNPMSSPDGIAIASAGEPIYSLLALSEDHIIAGGQSGNLYELKRGMVRKIGAHSQGVFRLIKYENSIISLGGDGFLKVWTADLEAARSFLLGTKSLRSIAVFDDGIAIGSSDGKLHLLNPHFQTLETVDLHENTIFALAYFPRLGCLFSGGRDAQIKSYHPITATVGEAIPAHLLHVHDLQLNPSNTLLASASMDKTIKIWDPQNMALLKVLDASKFGVHLNCVNALVWLTDAVLISSSDDRKVCVWEFD